MKVSDDPEEGSKLFTPTKVVKVSGRLKIRIFFIIFRPCCTLK
jgi:hypothetical protein